MDSTFIIAKNIVKTRYEDLSPQVVEAVKKEVIDSLGVGLAGSTCQGIPELTGLLASFGGKKQSTVIASGIKMPVIFAAQINASMMHALDYDDAVDQAVAHPGIINVPVCFALSEYRGKISGKQCITAIALGVDLMARLGLATRYKVSMVRAGWFYASLNGYMTAAAVAGKLLSFNEETLVNAIGLAYQKTSGNQQAVIDGALAKRMAAGFAASGGILAALMAEKGITGAKNCLEGEYGFYNLYHRGGFDKETLLKDLGADFKAKDLTIKLYPSCRLTHPFIDAALALAKEQEIKPEQVETVTIFCGENACSLSLPLEVKSNPRTTVDAQFSVPWGVASAIVKRKFSIGEISQEAIRDAEIINFCKKIQVEKDPKLTSHALEPGRIRINTNTGSFVKQVDIPSGSPQNPVSYSACADKFRECAASSAKPLTEETIEWIIDTVAGLENMEDISPIINKLK